MKNIIGKINPVTKVNKKRLIYAVEELLNIKEIA
jgi:hypothetical protein